MIMKFNAGLAKSLLMAASVGMVVPVVFANVVEIPANQPKPTPTPKPKPSKPPVAPEDTKAGKAADDPSKIKLPGQVVARAKGGFLSLAVENGKFVLRMYDAKKSQIPVEAARANARWRTNKTIHEEHTVLNPADDGKALVGMEYVQPPYNFKVYLTLLNGDGTAGEDYRIDMAAPAADAAPDKH